MITAATALDEAGALRDGGVLIVDDDDGMRDTLVEILVASGIEAEGVASAAAARERHDELLPSVALVDHRLPDTPGIELGKLLKQRDPDLSVLLLTGYASLENAIAAVSQFDGYLTKPVPPAELVRAVRSGLEGAHLRRENRALIDQLRHTNLMLEESVAERTSELSGLLTMAEAVAESIELEDVVGACLRVACDVTEASYAGLYVTDETGLRLRAASDDARLPDELQPTTEFDAAEDAQIVPLAAGGTQVGALVLGGAKRTPMFRATLATSAAVAIQNAQRFARERETTERLTELSRMKSTFLATVSHELRTPLTAVIGFAEVLKRGLGTVSEQQRNVLVEHIFEQGKRLGVLIEDLLDATRVELGGLRVKPSPQNIAEIAARVRVSFDGNPNPVLLRIPPDLALVLGDEARLEQVLTNLVGNAIKHSPAGSPVEVRAALDGRDGVAITVVDFGEGIDPAFLEHVFEPFAQADANGRRDGGLGLGLYIVRGLVEAMGGSIDVRSQVGRGSEFNIRLPLAVERPVQRPG